jgi:HlyD family secretion protein
MKTPSRASRRILLGAAAVLVAVAIFLALRGGGAVELTGIVTTDSVIVSAEIPGRIEQLLVREGDTVQAGQLVATIQAAEPQADLSFYESSERQAAALAAQAAADLKYQEQFSESQIRLAGANLESARSQAIAAAADFEQAAAAFRRADDLRRAGAIANEAYDLTKNTLVAVTARRDAAITQTAAAEATLGSAIAGRNQVEARRESVKAANDLAAAATAQKDKARARLARTEIRAPSAGIVNVRASRPGEVVSAGQAIVTLVNPDDLWVRLDLEESYLDRVRLGDKVTVRLPSGSSREGAVFYRASEADYATQRDVSRTKRDIRTFQLRVRCDNRDRSLAVGLTAYVTLPLAGR